MDFRLGIPTTLLGLLLERLGIAHSGLLFVWIAIFLLPVLAANLGFFSSLGSSHPVSLLMVTVLQFLYFYIPVSLVLFLIERMRNGNQERKGNGRGAGI